MKKLILSITFVSFLFFVNAQSFRNSQTFQQKNQNVSMSGELTEPGFNFFQNYTLPDETELVLDSIVYEEYNAETEEWERLKRYNRLVLEEGNCQSLYFKFWNDTTQQWKDYLLYKICYNDDDKETYLEKYISSIYMADDSVTYSGKTIIETEYFEELTTKVITYYRDQNSSGRLSEYQREEYKYDVWENQILYKNFKWDEQQEDWKEFEIRENLYDEYGNELIEKIMYWGVWGEKWHGDRYMEWCYNTLNEIDTFYNYAWDHDSLQWDNWSKHVYTYDADTNMISDILYYWDLEKSEWYFYGKVEYEYDPTGNEVLNQRSRWDIDSAKWIFIDKTEHAYDEFQNETLIAYYDWDIGRSIWIGSSEKYEKEYNEHNKLILSASYDWNPDQENWIGISKETYEYNEHGNRIRTLLFEWDLTQHEWSFLYDKSKSEYEYNENNQVISQVTRVWDVTIDTFVNSEKVEKEYDENTHLVMTITSVWNSSLEGYEYSKKSEYVYDVQGRRLESANYYWNKSVNDWAGIDKKVVGFHATGEYTLDESYIWDGEKKEWKLKKRWEWGYDDDGFRVMNGTLEHVWNDVYWGNRSYDIYDTDNKLILRSSYSWDDAVKDWRGNYKDENVWREKNRLDTTTTSFWDEMSWNWIPSHRSVYFYSEKETNANIVDVQNNLKVYPNPAQDYVVFEVVGANQEASLELFDINGKLWMKKPLFGKERINIGALEQGIYVWRVIQNDFVQRGKLIIN